MLEAMRRHAYSWVTRVLLGFIVLVFMFWGIGSGLFNQVHPIATIDGQRILADQVDTEARQLRDTIQSMYGQNAPAVLKSMNLREEALDRIIENHLIAQEARRLGIQVSTQALEQKIAAQKGFQVDGQFDFQAYQEILRDHGMQPNEYEDLMRSDMTAETLKQMIDQGIDVSEDEAQHAYDLRNQRVGLAYIEVPWQQFSAQVNPTDKQITDYYKQHAEEFREPERAKVEFIHYEPLALAATYTPSDQEIESYYKYNLKKEFTHPDLVHARHILIEVQSGATPQEKAAAKAKAEEVLKQLKAGGDFKALAEKYSDDTSNKHSGGDLGFFPRGQIIKPFEDAAFAMKPGDIAIVETRFGYHVVKVEESKPAHVDTLQEARPKIIDALRSQAGAKLARQAIDEDLSVALTGESLEDIAKKRGLDAVNPPSFAKGEPVQGVSQDSGLSQAAFTVDAGKISAVPGPAPYLLKVIERTPSRIPPLKEIDAKVRDAYVRAAAEADARVAAQKLIDQIKTPADFKRVAEAGNLTIHDVDPFERSQQVIPGLGEFPEVADAAGVIAQVPGVIGSVMEQGGNSYIFEVTSRTVPDDDAWQTARDSFTEEYLSSRRARAWTQFLDELKSHAKITINADQLGGTSESSM
ncbi:MAG: SurA N-terminal domain-containing protein [Candidatus Binataceae bacterium]